MAKKLDKEMLFQDYFETAGRVFATFEHIFQVQGVCAQIFGMDVIRGPNVSDAEIDTAKARVRGSDAWQILSRLYDYAVDGIQPSSVDPTDIVIGGAEVLSYLTTENLQPAGVWKRIVTQGDGRFALDDGEDLTLDRLALLASVDVRTVRNAISNGDLISNKVEGMVFIDNISARNWLSGRRAFIPTRIPEERIDSLQHITMPAEFGAFLRAQRTKLGLDSGANNILILHPSVNAKAITEVEQGVFKLPLDAAYPLADFYQLNRKEFLGAVMQVFFREELTSLREILKTN